LVQDTDIVAKLVVGSHQNDEAHKHKTSVVTLESTTPLQQTHQHRLFIHTGYQIRNGKESYSYISLKVEQRSDALQLKVTILCLSQFHYYVEKLILQNISFFSGLLSKCLKGDELHAMDLAKIFFFSSTVTVFASVFFLFIIYFIQF